MDGVTELAMHIKALKNPAPYTSMFGKIIALPDLKIQLGDKILLYDDDIKATFDIYETRDYNKYVNLNKEVVFLPYSKEINLL